MSLSEALLLDAYPFEVWIAARTDGAKGSGNQADPYDGSTIKTAPVSISLSASGLLATATTFNPHGFITGDLVIIGVPGALESDWWDGWFAITPVSGEPTKFTYTMKKAPTTSSPTDRVVQKIVEFRFDRRMSEAPTNARIHIGPGLFETRGTPEDYATGFTGFKLLSGQHISGAGMGLTTIRSQGAARPNQKYSVIGTNIYLDGFELSDLTLDCNLDGAPSYYIECGAIKLSGGTRVRVRRVRGINFGSRATIPPDNYTENFVFILGTGANQNTSDVIFEECVAERPCPDVYWNSTILSVGSGEIDGTNYYVRAGVLRNNFVNGQLVFGQRVEIADIGFSSGVATITTKTPHGHIKPGNVSVQGILVGSATNNAFNGVFAIESIASETQLTYKPYTADGPTATDLSGGPDAIIGAPVSPHFLPLSVTAVGGDPKVTITTPIPHNLTKENLANVNGIRVNNIDPGQLGNPFNGTFGLTDPLDVLSKTQLVYTMANPSPSSPSFAGSDPSLGKEHIALTAEAGTTAVVEGNRVLHIGTGGPWSDFWSTRDLTARDNYYHDVAGGPNEGRGQRTATPKKCNLTHSGLIATCTRWPGSETHDLVVGQGVLIRGALISGSANNPFNSPQLGATQELDPFVLKSVTPNSFTYEMRSIPTADPDPSPNPDGSPTSTFAGLDYVLNLVWENNIIELQLTRPQYWAGPTGLYCGQGAAGFVFLPDAAYRFRNVLIRRNVIRQLADRSVSNYAGITVQKAENAVIESNIISLGQSLPIQFDRCGLVKTLSNTTAGGKVIQGYNRETHQNQDETATTIEDAIVLALL